MLFIKPICNGYFSLVTTIYSRMFKKVPNLNNREKNNFNNHKIGILITIMVTEVTVSMKMGILLVL